MEKQNKIITVLIIVLMLIMVGVCVYSITRKETITTSDAEKFKEEYESLNGAINDDGKIYPSVEISVENPIVYKTDAEIIDVINNENAIIYFGFKNCAWCRNMIETLLKVAKDSAIKTIYYVNIYDIRDSYKLDDNQQVEKTIEGTESYMKILKFLGDSLENYYLKDSEGNLIDTKTTRLYAPTVIAVKDGKLKAIHAGTVNTQTDPFASLTDEQKNELYDIYTELVNSINYTPVCETSDNC